MWDVLYYVAFLAVIYLWWRIYLKGTKEPVTKDEHEENSI